MSETAQEVYENAMLAMEGALEALDRNFGRVRTGKASLSLVDNIRVDYYGTPTPLSQVASLKIPEPRLITIQPWEQQLLPLIEKAIFKSEMDLNPVSDGKLIRIPIPKLTEDRRKELAKVVNSMAEEGRVSVRNGRREGNSELDKLHKDKLLSDDDVRREKDRIQKLTDDYVAKVDAAAKKKEAEILEI